MSTLQDLILLSLGSNTGNRHQFLADAREALVRSDIHIIRASRVLENPALLYTDQNDFLNQILQVETEQSAAGLLKIIKGIEQQLGRKKRFQYGPREIDIDILIYGNTALAEDTLTIPHPGLKDREYLHILMTEMGFENYIDDFFHKE